MKGINTHKTTAHIVADGIEKKYAAMITGKELRELFDEIADDVEWRGRTIEPWEFDVYESRILGTNLLASVNRQVHKRIKRYRSQGVFAHGGKRDGAGRPTGTGKPLSRKKRCACGQMTAKRAKARAHKCEVK